MTLRYRVSGLVQGVGFRPFVFRLARELGVAGWVRNTPGGVDILAAAPEATLREFAARLRRDAPPAARVVAVEARPTTASAGAAFAIRPSTAGGPVAARLLPDLAVCPDCLAELFDPRDRRFRYPFLNCTQCGPRFSILERLPYDRAHTTMRAFEMCPACRREYDDPRDRRFHAQPNACPACGPHLDWRDPRGRVLAARDDALRAAAAALEQGAIVAVKGLGGFHLMARADRDAVVRELRRRKRREAKPLALMYPDPDRVARDAELSAAERRLLQSPAAPIVLLRRRARARGIAAAVAPDNPCLGILLPHTPLHHLLLRAWGRPVVATSGNLAEEPPCIAESEALERLGGIADFFLMHNRPIARPLDDSLARVVLGRELVLRAGRGYAPLSITLGPGPATGAPPLLAVGAQLKNTVALAHHGVATVSPHVGDLDSALAADLFRQRIRTLETVLAARPARVACDLHPDYPSTRHARRLAVPATGVQHHHAHIAAAMAEHGLTGRVLGVAWDGTGYGPDGTVWGGEFLLAGRGAFRRWGHFRTFPLPGGEQAVREPRRSALGLLYALRGEALFQSLETPPLPAFQPAELRVLRRLLAAGRHCPPTSSVGRLFDAAAALLGLAQVSRFEGEAAMRLEFAADPVASGAEYPYSARERDGLVIVDWAEWIDAMLDDLLHSRPAGLIAARFHRTLARVIADLAARAAQPRVVLSGGCFQNARLLELTVRRLRRDGFEVYWPRHVPPNDGGIALGQLAVAAAAGEAC